MNTSLALTALIMGVVGGPHCMAMCGAACAGIAGGAAPHEGKALFAFQLSRVIGYSAFGAVAAGTVQGLALVGQQTAVIRPLWTLFHVLALLLGLVLLWQARQPAFVDDWGQQVWRRARPMLSALGPRAPWVLGVAWALMPCGLLYSALLVASLSANALDGALVMAAFGLGSALVLSLGPWLWLRVRQARSGATAMRLAGLALALTSGWALWMGLTQPTGLWCA